MKEPECKSCDEVIQSFDRTLKLLDQTIIKAKKGFYTTIDSVILTEAYETMSRQGVDVKL
jgi:5-bromo-4-chloroindolyl phosphate hydrolysis protein